LGQQNVKILAMTVDFLKWIMANKKTKFLLIIFLIGILLTIGIAVYSQICVKPDIEFQVYKDGIYVVSIDADYFAENSDIYVSKSLETVEKAAKENNAKVAINAGFFDPNNGKTTSYILKNNQIVENPENNERLTQSEELKPYFDKILNRSEFRVLKCPVDEIFQNEKITSYKTIFEIKNHYEPLPPSDYCNLVYSIQAGPELVPNFDLEKEFFILKKDNKVVRESASALHKFARSAIGIKKDRILFVAASNKNPMTLEELAGFMKEIGAEKAMAFDGGSSTSLYVDISEKKEFLLTSAKDNAARRVKSILIVK